MPRPPTEDTKPEQVVRGILEDFQREGFIRNASSQERIKTRFRIYSFRVDFFLGDSDVNLVVEVMGEHWHSPRTKRGRKRKKKDDAKRECLLAEGYNYIELWDSELMRKGGKEADPEKVEKATEKLRVKIEECRK